MKLSERIEAFVALGDFLAQFEQKIQKKKQNSAIPAAFYEEFEQLIEQIHLRNGWFTPFFVRRAIGGIRRFLKKEELEKWVENYSFPQKAFSKKTGVVMAGNVPLVGFHDLLSVLIAGHIFVGKLSSKDDVLLKFLTQVLKALNPEFENFIFFEKNILKNFDAIIATGSNNSARYFEYYFGKYPHIIRKNRHSAAVLTGKEEQADLKALADDIFLYCGLGCRNVSKIFVPKGYDFQHFFPPMESYAFLRDHNKYANNYHYHKSVYLMNQTPFLDNGFVILRQHSGYSSPIGVIFFENYTQLSRVQTQIERDRELLQCVVSQEDLPGTLPLGKSQSPELWDYADGIDTLAFLLDL